MVSQELYCSFCAQFHPLLSSEPSRDDGAACTFRRNRWVNRFNLSQVGELSAIQYVVTSIIVSCMDGDFYTTLRWRLLRGFMLWFYGRRCMRCGSTYRIEVDHIIARARGEFGREYQWMPRNLQILCHEHNQEKMIKFDDWRPFCARVLMPVRNTPAAHRAEIRAAFGPHEYRKAPLQAVEVGCSDPLSSYPSNTRDPAAACVTTPALLTRASTGLRGRRWAGWLL